MNNYRFQFNIVTYRVDEKWYAYCAEPVPDISRNRSIVLPPVEGDEMEEVRDKMAKLIGRYIEKTDEVFQFAMTMLP